MINVFLKVTVAGAFLVGLCFVVLHLLDLDSLEGHGSDQEKVFEQVLQEVDNIEGVDKYKIFRPVAYDGISPSSNIQGVISTKSGILLHSHFSTYFDKKETESLCLDWTLNGIGIDCKKNGTNIHPCNAGVEVLAEFPFYKFDIQQMVENGKKSFEKLNDLDNSTTLKFDNTIICRPVVRIPKNQLAISLMCSENDAVCKTSLSGALSR